MCSLHVFMSAGSADSGALCPGLSPRLVQSSIAVSRDIRRSVTALSRAYPAKNDVAMMRACITESAKRRQCFVEGKHGNTPSSSSLVEGGSALC